MFHNRLTHVLKVAQIGRGLAAHIIYETKDKGLATRLGGLDPDVVEAAALAHDLGHPPFGHIAEHELDTLVKEAGETDGFEGNPQSFRIVTKLVVRSNDCEGLNLTSAMLNALLKYPWFRGTGGTKKERKWGAYHTEEDDFICARKSMSADERPCVEAALMDWADDIAYSVYDMEDAYRAGKVPLDRLFPTRSEKLSPEADRFLEKAFQRWSENKVQFDQTTIRNTFTSLAALFPFPDPYSGSREQRATLRSLTSSLVARYIGAVDLNEASLTTNEQRISIEPEAKNEVEILKELTWQYVIEDPSLTTQQHGYRKIIVELFTIFQDAAKKERWVLFPIGFRERLEDAKNAGTPPQVRLVADFIASMTEQQALEMYQRMVGISFGSVLRTIL